jgi:acyl-CoA synthetase (AMP-forming)/AMP-acid ligase II
VSGTRGSCLARIVDEPARLDPGRAALVLTGEVATGEVVTYGDLADASLRCSRSFAELGLAKGSWVPVVDDAGLLSVASVVGLARAGYAAALMNPRLRSGELRVLVEGSGAARTAVAGPAAAGAVREALGAEPLGARELLGDAAGGPADGSPAAGEPRAPEDVALVLFTSGTTGLPKPVPLTEAGIGSRLSTFSAPFEPGAPPAVSLMCVPLVHVGGMLGLLVQLAAGNTTVVQPRFEAGEWLRLVAEHRVSRTFLVPTMLHRILEHPSFGSTDLSSLRNIAYGAAPASPTLVARAVEAMPGVSFSNVFGQTETLGAITALGPDDHAPGSERIASVGRPLPGVAVRIVEPGTGRDVPAGEVGELWARTGYTAGWVRTGDLVRQDLDGYLYVMGRIGETINRAGEKFAPFEVEEAARSHPSVRDVAVVAVPDAEMGSRVGTAVVADGPLDAAELRRFCSERLAPFKLPEHVVQVDEIPYSETGKVRRRELAELIAARLGLPG